MRIKTLEELLAIENWDQDEYEQCLLNLRDTPALCDQLGNLLMQDSTTPQEDGIFDLISVLSFGAGWLERFYDIDGDIWEKLYTAVKKLPLN